MALPRPCCCGIVTDDFNRAGPGYGSAWNKESGTDPTISSNELVFSAPAVLRHLTAHPNGNAGKAQARAKGKFHTAGDSVRLIAAWLDGNNYIYMQVTYQDSGSPFGTANCSWLRIGWVLAGVDAHLSDVPLDGLAADVQHTLYLCWFPDRTSDVGYMVASINLANGKWFGRSSPVTNGSPMPEIGSYAAVAVVSGGAKVDDFYYGKAEGTGCDSACPNCGTPCPISDDDFNRADSADNQVGCKWFVRDGHQHINTNQWEITADDSRAQHLVMHPGVSGGGLIAYIDMKDVAGKKGRLYLGLVYLQYEPTAGGHTLSIYEANSTGPTGTLVGTPVTDSIPATGAMVTLKLCIGPGAGYPTGVIADASAPGLCTQEPVSSSSGGVAFIGGSNGTILDNFRLEKYRSHPPSFPADPDCATCGCPGTCLDCIEGTRPRLIAATISASGASSICEPTSDWDLMDGISYVLDEDGHLHDPECPYCFWNPVHAGMVTIKAPTLADPTLIRAFPACGLYINPQGLVVFSIGVSEIDGPGGDGGRVHEFTAQLPGSFGNWNCSALDGMVLTYFQTKVYGCCVQLADGTSNCHFTGLTITLELP